MHFPENVKYTKDHEWVRETDEGTVFVGITDFAQSQLGDIVFVNLPEVGDSVTMGEEFCDMESVKAVYEIYSPVSGVIKTVNESLLDSLEIINRSPYEAWFIEVEGITGTVELLSAAEYAAHCE